MPNNFSSWLGLIASITTLLAFWLFIRERHKRERQADLFLGFLHGIKALVKGMAQAGEEWRYKVNDKPEGYSRGYGNTCTNTWITLREQINDMLSRIGKREKT